MSLSVGESVHIQGLTDAVRNTTITRLWFHGSKTGSGGVKALHWHLFFELGTGGHSVEFNSQQVVLDKITKLFINYRAYTTSNRSTVGGCWSIAMRPGTTVAQVLALVLHNRRDRYRLTNDGSGCRFWCKTVLADLEGSEYVAGGSGRDIEVHLQELNRKMGNQWVPYPLIQGTFY